MTNESQPDKLRVFAFIGLFIVAITLATSVMLGPAIGNVFVASVQSDTLLQQEQHDLDSARAQIYQMSPVLGLEMLIGALLTEIGILSLIAAVVYARAKNRFAAAFTIGGLCDLGLLG